MARRVSNEIEQAAMLEYQKGTPVKQIMALLGISAPTVKRIRRRLGVPQRKRNHVLEKHPNWKGGRRITRAGYVAIRVHADDPIGVEMSGAKQGDLREHRLVMAHSLGRALLPSETVHHINGVRSDNRLENLQLRSGNHGPGVARVCQDCGSQNIEERQA